MWKKIEENCHYPTKGVGLLTRTVHKAVCQWHGDMKDPVCLGCAYCKHEKDISVRKGLTK